MNFRRLPFQFSATDPVERQVELQKRFGLSATSKINKDQPNMYVDVDKPAFMGGGSLSSNASTSNSPRLQHRVPIFVEGGSKGKNLPFTHQAADTHLNKESQQNGKNVDCAGNTKPNVRVIPIQVEGMGNVSSETNSIKNSDSNHIDVDSHKSRSSKKKVNNIPIKIEGKTQGSSVTPKPNSDAKPSNTLKLGTMPPEKQNGHSKASSSKVPKVKEPQIALSLPLRQIRSILNEVQSYKSRVENFTGNDKEYRYLDEMLTRFMLNLDDVDTLGKADVRSARKAAIKQVQANIDLLESKFNARSAVKDDAIMAVQGIEMGKKHKEKVTEVNAKTVKMVLDNNDQSTERKMEVSEDSNVLLDKCTNRDATSTVPVEVVDRVEGDYDYMEVKTGLQEISGDSEMLNKCVNEDNELISELDAETLKSIESAPNTSTSEDTKIALFKKDANEIGRNKDNEDPSIVPCTNIYPNDIIC